VSNALEVGTRFTNRAARRWRDDDGDRHNHTYTLECRVTEVTTDGLTWERLSVIDEADRPETGAFLPEHGKMAWFGWEAAANRGDVEVTR
jgi:hypothetical protein